MSACYMPILEKLKKAREEPSFKLRPQHHDTSEDFRKYPGLNNNNDLGGQGVLSLGLPPNMFAKRKKKKRLEEEDSTDSSGMSPSPGPRVPPRAFSPCPSVKMHPRIITELSSPYSSTPLEDTSSSSSSAADSSDSLGLLRQRFNPPDKLSPRVHKMDLGYHTLKGRTTPSTSSLDDLWDVRATKTAISDLHLLTHNAKHLPVSKRAQRAPSEEASPLSFLPDSVLLRILSFLTSNEIVQCSRVSRRFYFLSWDPSLWRSITLTGEGLEADLALKTIVRLLSRNTSSSNKLAVDTIVLGGCHRLTDRGLAIIARRCPSLQHLELQHCVNITNGGVMDLVTKCNRLDHLDVTGCSMLSTIGVHQAAPVPSMRNTFVTQKRMLNLQFLDLTDCASLEDTGIKIMVETCPQLFYLFLRRCMQITDVGLKYVSSYCLSLRELSVSDCTNITDFGLYELAKLGPNLRYLSVAKCDQISDSGVKQIAKLCYKLRYLNVRGCEAVSDEAIEMLARSCSRLRSLDIGKCDVTDVGLKMLSENCPNLKKLSVKSCEMVTDQGVQCVAYYCRGLQQLNIQDCPVTLEGYRTVKKYCRKCIIEHTNPGFY